MKSTSIILATLLLAGAGGVVWWQLDKTEEHSEENIAEEVVKIREAREARDSRFQKLTDNSVRWQVRVDMLRSLDAASLNQEDINTLYDLLTYTPVPGQEENWWVVANEIMEQMRLKAIAPDRYAKEMLAIIRNPAAPEVLRDYAVQHLGQWVTPRGAELGQPSEQDPTIVKETAEAFAALVTDPTNARSSIPGTTLMVLIDMKGGGVPEDVINPVLETLDPWFEGVLSGRNASSKITTISTINAIGMLRLETFRPEIHALATNEATDPSLRLNSIATLGQIGTEADLGTLQSIARSNSRLRHAAQAAYGNLSDKF
ncbi:MAG: HEAT repeat domain-containing protein [Luteolibacter sp.]